MRVVTRDARIMSSVTRPSVHSIVAGKPRNNYLIDYV
jgi:hypothetical protein